MPIFSLIITQMAITISWAYDYRPYNNNDDHKLRTDSNDKLSDNDQTKIKKKKKKKRKKKKKKEKKRKKKKKKKNRKSKTDGNIRRVGGRPRRLAPGCQGPFVRACRVSYRRETAPRPA